ncbi:SRPBCC family protein [Myxococcus sp. CA040A]|uniref:SRPBCC family protein n=1 Tax=Myxococcus sp. CA040A TaxID=2741738 RepID=UPI00157B4B2D|nr:SRPBCC family protein [Myxococcus sp. CA040A]NTX04643.1 SRPBCC family protein [Myxococcus sp. CA040A]
MKKTSGVISTVIVVLLLFAIGQRPGTFRVERSATIHAPADVVFALVNDFRYWEQWSPWWKLEPTQQVSLAGAASGVGAIYEWRGERTGSGRMEIMESRPPAYVRIRLDFTAPMRATNTTEYLLTPTADGVKLTWVMSGENTFAGKALQLFASMDEVMGRDFERGLADIKSVAEASRGSSAPSVGEAGFHGDALTRDAAHDVVVTREPLFPRE